MKVISLVEFDSAITAMRKQARINQNTLRPDTVNAARLHLVYGVPVLQVSLIYRVSREAIYRIARRAESLVDYSNARDIGDAPARAALFDKAGKEAGYLKSDLRLITAKMMYVYGVPYDYIDWAKTPYDDAMATIGEIKSVLGIYSAE